MKRLLTVLMICLQVVFLLSSCGTSSKHNLSLFTKFNADIVGSGVEKTIVLETQYSSNTTLTMEVGLLENFAPVSFFALQNNKKIEDNLFSLDLENTGEKVLGLESEFSLLDFLAWSKAEILMPIIFCAFRLGIVMAKYRTHHM